MQGEADHRHQPPDPRFIVPGGFLQRRAASAIRRFSSASLPTLCPYGVRLSTIVPRCAESFCSYALCSAVTTVESARSCSSSHAMSASVQSRPSRSLLAGFPFTVFGLLSMFVGAAASCQTGLLPDCPARPSRRSNLALCVNALILSPMDRMSAYLKADRMTAQGTGCGRSGGLGHRLHQRIAPLSLMPCSGSVSPPALSLRVASRLTSNPGPAGPAGVSRQPRRTSRAVSESLNPTFGVPVKPPPTFPQNRVRPRPTYRPTECSCEGVAIPPDSFLIPLKSTSCAARPAWDS